MTNIFLFRNDLRLADNPGLAAALSGGNVVLVYVLDEKASENWTMGAASRWWLHHSLSALSADIAARGGRLVLRRGDARRIIPDLAVAVGAQEVHTGRAFEPASRAQEREIAESLQSRGIGLRGHNTALLFEPEDIRTKTGGFYRVYTPFVRACAERLPPAPAIAAPARLDGPEIESDSLDDWLLLPSHPDWAGGLRQTWTPGEAGAAERLRHFLKHQIETYETGRNIPGEDGTSRLSPHLHFGEISVARAWSAVMRRSGHGPEAFRRELLWREFSAYLLWHCPTMPDAPLRPEFAKLPWPGDEKSRRAWQRGATGIPIVDAGMRQLWQTGWMHNRVRMVCASFLVKHLGLSWQQGEAWFWDTLVDADLASNSNNWQWVAGSGADAAPFFRIFNPILQGQKFDPKGDYVRRYVPELSHLPERHIHAPWEAPAQVLAAAGVHLGQTYPEPIINLSQGRQRALDAYRQITAKNG